MFCSCLVLSDPHRAHLHQFFFWLFWQPLRWSPFVFHLWKMAVTMVLLRLHCVIYFKNFFPLKCKLFRVETWVNTSIYSCLSASTLKIKPSATSLPLLLPIPTNHWSVSIYIILPFQKCHISATIHYGTSFIQYKAFEILPCCCMYR